MFAVACWLWWFSLRGYISYPGAVFCEFLLLFLPRYLLLFTPTSYQPPPCLGRPPTRRCPLCGRAAPHLSLHRPSPSVTGYVRWASGHRAAQCGHVTVTQGWGSFDAAAAALAAERNVNKRYQLIGRVRSCRHRHPVIFQFICSPWMSRMLNVRSLLRKYDDVVELCRDRRISPRRGTTLRAPFSVVCAGPATTSSTDRVHAPLTTTCPSTMAAASCRRLPSLNRPPSSNNSFLGLFCPKRHLDRFGRFGRTHRRASVRGL